MLNVKYFDFVGCYTCGLVPRAENENVNQKCWYMLFLPEDPDLYHWTVDRRYHDFYTLESKLTEFHGEFPDTQLPPKRILFGPRGIEFMESKRQVFIVTLLLPSVLQ